MPIAALLTEFGAPLQIREIDLDPPGPGEVSVRLAASGICHTDFNTAKGAYAHLEMPLPMVLGHEGAGVVTEVGAGVTRLAPGDHVILSAMPQCGECFFCRRGRHVLCEVWRGVKRGHLLDGTTRFHADGNPVFHMNAGGTFSEQTVVPEISAVKVDPAMPLDLAAIIGCAVVTGNGTARHVAQIEPGDVVVVMGAGGVGLNIVEGARLAGAGEIVVIDTVGWKLDLARRFGATRTVEIPDEDPRAIVLEITMGRGADVVIEAAGPVAAILSAIDLTRAGGEVVIVAAGGESVDFSFADGVLRPGRTIKGAIYGNADVQRAFPELVDLHLRDQLHLDELITSRIDIHQINDAFEDMEAGKVARALVVYDQ